MYGNRYGCMMASFTSVDGAPLAHEPDAGAQIGVVHPEPVATLEIVGGDNVAAYQFIELEVRQRLEEDAAAIRDRQTRVDRLAFERVHPVGLAMPVRAFALGHRIV